MTRSLHVVRPDEGDGMPAPGPAASVSPVTPVTPLGVLGSGVRFTLVGSEASAGSTRQDLGDHAGVFGPRPSAVGAHGAELLDAITTIGLTGRGGGHFPLAIKWRAALAAGGGGTVVVNGAESEACSAPDAALLPTSGRSASGPFRFERASTVLPMTGANGAMYESGVLIWTNGATAATSPRCSTRTASASAARRLAPTPVPARRRTESARTGAPAR